MSFWTYFNWWKFGCSSISLTFLGFPLSKALVLCLCLGFGFVCCLQPWGSEHNLDEICWFYVENPFSMWRMLVFEMTMCFPRNCDPGSLRLQFQSLYLFTWFKTFYCECYELDASIHHLWIWLLSCRHGIGGAKQMLI
jgi:hypothetical protein